MKKLLSILILLSITACTAPLQAPPTKIDIPVLLPAPPRPMTMLGFEWNVFTNEEETWFALTSKGYQSLILDWAEIERYIEQLELNDGYLREQINPSEDSSENPQT